MDSVRALLRSLLLFILPTVVLCTAALELGLRVMGRLPSNTTEGIFEQHGHDAYRLRKNQSKLSRTPSYSCMVHTNSWGHRDRKPGPHPYGDKPYIAFVGDSITFGNGVEFEHSFVGVFAERAAKHGVDVANLAVGGFRFSDEELSLRELVQETRVPPSHAILVLTVQGLATFEQPYTDVMIKNGYVFFKHNWVVPYVTVTLGNASSAYCFFRDGLRKAQSKLKPGGTRVALEMLKPFSRKDEPLLADPKVAERLEQRLTEFDQRTRAAGVTPVYVYMPTSVDLGIDDFVASMSLDPQSYDFEFYAKLSQRHAERAGIQFVDVTAPLLSLKAKGKTLGFAQDPHYVAEANAVLGDFLYDTILAKSPGNDGAH